MYLRIHIKTFELGLRFDRGEFTGIVRPGNTFLPNLLGRIAVQVVSVRDVYLKHPQLDVIVRSGALAGLADVYELTDTQRALVWIDGRFNAILGPGLHALLTGQRRIRVEVVDLAQPRFAAAELEAILASGNAAGMLTVHEIPAEHVGLVIHNGRPIETLTPGRYAFWKGIGNLRVITVDRREIQVDVAGQEILTADKVTLRLNAQLVYRVVDADKAVATADDVKSVVYRETQLALRAAVGTRELDALLNDKDALGAEVTGAIRPRAKEFGVDVVTVGVRDLILPGEMRDLLNKVIEAKKAAEAGVITRREEAAGLRHQANAAKLYADNPTLFRLRELEAVEKIATHGKLSVVLGDLGGDKGLADRIVNLI
jgi:regulator of protease activity HflC (stomatin/prohibitin superfamily)